MRDRPEPVIPPPGPGPHETGEIGSEGGSPGDLLSPSVRPRADASGAERHPGGVPALLWWTVLVPVVVVLLWFLTSLGSH
jgi:hypothetical protein